MNHTFYVASDHAGFLLKEYVKDCCAQHYPDLNVIDLGTDGEESVDYPDFGYKAAYAVADTPDAMGVVICGSGIGISIAANRVMGIRAALCQDANMATLAREHNNANILALGARLINQDTARKCLDAFLTTPFGGDRHLRRVEKLG